MEKFPMESLEGKHSANRKNERASGCASCRTFEKLYDSKTLTSGMHLKRPAKRLKGLLYDHHLIVDEVLKEGKDNYTRVSIIHNVPKKGLEKKEENISAAGIWYIAKYIHGNNYPDVLANARKEMSESKNVNDSSTLVDARDDLTKEKNKKRKYNVLNNNCEHFATKCVTGERGSYQLREWIARCGLFWHILKFFLIGLALASDNIINKIKTKNNFTVTVAEFEFVLVVVLIHAVYIIYNHYKRHKQRREKTHCRFCYKVWICEHYTYWVLNIATGVGSVFLIFEIERNFPKITDDTNKNKVIYVCFSVLTGFLSFMFIFVLSKLTRRICIGDRKNRNSHTICKMPINQDYHENSQMPRPENKESSESVSEMASSQL